MPYFDIGLIIIIGIFGLIGLAFGLVQTLGSLLGMILGVFIAARYYEVGAEWITSFTGWGGNFPKVLIFIIAFVIINRLVGLVFWLINKILSIVTRLPFISSINRLLGLVFGVLEGAIGLGIILYFVARFPLGETFMGALGASRIVPILVHMAGVLMPLVPEGLRILQSTIESLR
ncbi:MAG: hypothetical protein A3J93_00245 [Candidatus Magasanikbacteria bacterium RIFOXYC2_FULL_42_28]|uniref:Colicin V production protein n=1 Tax=Candidatus Magasanikbacteria bacterium RIFOXYC2_FULL_42_28 TaxID=1798704 RepID=A0A1F6NWB9_9BACT|nr:MAG: hypothetical protein A3J93_00245 [Candidatus Magasanikbacteria bacterium RIFOXYC2_FULL_42_28]